MPEIVSFLSLEMHEAASVVPMGVGKTTASNRIPKDFISLNPHLIDFYVSRARFFLAPFYLCCRRRRRPHKLKCSACTSIPETQ